MHTLTLTQHQLCSPARTLGQRKRGPIRPARRQPLPSGDSHAPSIICPGESTHQIAPTISRTGINAYWLSHVPLSFGPIFYPCTMDAMAYLTTRKKTTHGRSPHPFCFFLDIGFLKMRFPTFLGPMTWSRVWSVRYFAPCET